MRLTIYAVALFILGLIVTLALELSIPRTSYVEQHSYTKVFPTSRSTQSSATVVKPTATVASIVARPGIEAENEFPYAVAVGVPSMRSTPIRVGKEQLVVLSKKTVGVHEVRPSTTMTKFGSLAPLDVDAVRVEMVENSVVVMKIVVRSSTVLDLVIRNVSIEPQRFPFGWNGSAWVVTALEKRCLCRTSPGIKYVVLNVPRVEKVVGSKTIDLEVLILTPRVFGPYRVSITMYAKDSWMVLSFEMFVGGYSDPKTPPPNEVVELMKRCHIEGMQHG